MLGLSWFSKLLFGGLALILAVMAASDLRAILLWERVDARVTAVTERCSVMETQFSSCADATRAAFRQRTKLTRQPAYTLAWLDRDGQIEERRIDGKSEIRVFGEAGRGEIISLRLNPDVSKPPVQTKDASFYILIVGVIALIVWFTFWPVGRKSLWGMVSIFEANKENSVLALAQLSWRGAFFCLWLALFAYFAAQHDARIREQYVPLSAKIEAMEEQCVVVWREWMLLRRVEKRTGRMDCEAAEQQLANMTNRSARIEPGNRYLLTYSHPNDGERAALKWSSDFPGEALTMTSKVALFAHPFRGGDVVTSARLGARNDGSWFLYGSLCAMIIFGVIGLRLYGAAKGPGTKIAYY